MVNFLLQIDLVIHFRRVGTCQTRVRDSGTKVLGYGQIVWPRYGQFFIAWRGRFYCVMSAIIVEYMEY